MSTTGYEKRIALTCPHFSRGQVKKAAKQLEHLAGHLQTERDFYAALRVLGMTPDPTAAAAVTPRRQPTRHLSAAQHGEYIADGIRAK